MILECELYTRLLPHSGFFFPKTLIFPNELLAREILFWTVDCFKRVYCVITNNSIASNTYVANYIYS